MSIAPSDDTCDVHAWPWASTHRSRPIERTRLSIAIRPGCSLWR